jgi:VWA domain containing CoxE-like protein
VTRVALPLADAPALAPLARRTALIRWVLALAIAAVAVAAAFTTRSMRVGESAFFSPGSAGVIVLDLSSSTEAAPPQEIELGLNRIARSGRKTGLVLFSDVAYEALPPTAKAAELRPFIRYFHAPRVDPTNPFALPPRSERRRTNPWSSFRGGTRISSGLRLARTALERSHSSGVVLISDLNDSLFDLPQLTRTLHDYVRAGIRLRVVGLNPNPSDREFWVRQLGEQAFVPEPALTTDPAAHKTARLIGTFPRRLVLLGALLALLLALNELWGNRLSWRPT